MALILGLSALGGGIILKNSTNPLPKGGLLGGPSPFDEAEAAGPTFIGQAVLSSADIPEIPEIGHSLSTVSLESKDSGLGFGAPVFPASAVADSPAETAKLPSRFFIQPASGLNWGILHDHNAVDIANTCGTPVMAAAEGTVVQTAADGGWNDGYGNYVMVEHSNNIRTRYAHLQKVYASVGDFVNQGKVIATIGNTGNVQGITGCHLHFEVYGAKNPFAKK